MFSMEKMNKKGRLQYLGSTVYPQGVLGLLKE